MDSSNSSLSSFVLMSETNDHFEQPNPHTLIYYLLPDPSSIPIAKSMFCSMACEYDLECKELDPFKMQATLEEPIQTVIQFSMLTHATKGYLAIISYKPPSKLKSTLSSILHVGLRLVDDSSDCRQKQICKDWHKCNTHYQDGYQRFHERLFARYKELAIQNNFTFSPPDKKPICLDAICLPVNTMHSATITFNQSRNYYVDIDEQYSSSSKEILVECTSTKKMSVFARYQSLPEMFGMKSDVKLESARNGGSHFCKLTLSHSYETNLSTADTKILPLKCGRWFLQIRGDAVIGSGSYTLMVKDEPVQTTESFARETEESNSFMNEEKNEEKNEADEEEEWVIVADDSCPEGRKGRAQLVGHIPSHLLPKDTQLPPSTTNFLCPGGSEAVRLSSLDLDQIHRCANHCSPGRSPSRSSSLSSSNESATLENTSQSTSSTQSNLPEEPPHQFFCPITMMLMRDPVVAGDGHSYEYKAIEKWLEGHIRSPMTGELMPHKMLVFNHNLKSQIEEWKQTHPHWSE